MQLQLNGQTGMTFVSHAFIDQYMAGANGEFVKVYLCLLRAAQSGQQVTVSSLADALTHTESDIIRALKYWEKQGLVQGVYDAEGELQHLTVYMDKTENAGASAAVAAGTSTAKTAAAASTVKLPARPVFTTADQDRIGSKDEFRQIIFVGEQYLGRPLDNAELNDLLYFFDTLHFSSDVLEYLLEYCAEKGDPGHFYMEKVAEGWYKAGVTNTLQARENTKLFNLDYYDVFRAFGISGRKPAAREMEMMDRWSLEYGFPKDVITEACSRTIMQVSRPDFRYADGILKRWYESSVKTLADVQKMDEAYASAHAGGAGKSAGAGSASGGAASGGVAAGRSSSGTADGTKAKPRSGRQSSSSRFSNFQQRQYDWDQLSEALSSSEEGSSS